MLGEGMKVRFVPSFKDNMKYTPQERRENSITGVISYINWENKNFCVEFNCGGTTQKETFKFVDIGQAVSVIG
jgi:hypothetical protein